MTVGDGNSAHFWTDRLIEGQAISEIAPQVFSLVSKRLRKSMAVAQGLLDDNWVRPLRGKLHGEPIIQVLSQWPMIAHTQLSEEPDRLVWRWTANGICTAQSCYLASFHGSIQSDT